MQNIRTRPGKGQDWYDYDGDRDAAIRELQAAVMASDAVLRWDGTGTQPLRSTVTSEATRRVRWVQPVAPPAGNGYALASDVWERTP